MNGIKKSKKKIISHLKDEEKTFAELLDRTGLARSTLSTSIKELLSERVIKKREDSEDRRIKYYQIIDDSVFKDMDKVTPFQSIGDFAGAVITEEHFDRLVAVFVEGRLREEGLSEEEIDEFWKSEDAEEYSINALKTMPGFLFEDLVKAIGTSFFFALLKAEQNPEIGAEGVEYFAHEFYATFIPRKPELFINRLEELDFETYPSFFRDLKDDWDSWEEFIDGGGEDE